MWRGYAMGSGVRAGVTGADRLAPFGDLFIQQQVSMIEAFVGYEEGNKYDIFGASPPRNSDTAHTSFKRSTQALTWRSGGPQALCPGWARRTSSGPARTRIAARASAGRVTHSS